MRRAVRVIGNHWELLLLAAVSIALRLPYLTTRSLWYDEASSWQTAKFPPAEMMRSLRMNVHMPLYYFLLKGWMAVFGESTAALRGLSIALGALTAVGMGLFGRELYNASAATEGGRDEADVVAGGPRVLGLAVGLPIAVCPYQVLASIEARMYALGTSLAAFTAWLLLTILRGRGGAMAWWAYGAACIALLYTHHYGLFTVAAQFAFLFLYSIWLLGSGASADARRLGGHTLAVGAVVAVAYLPGLDILLTQSDHVRQDYWIRPMSWRTPATTFGEFLMPEEASSNPEPVGWAILALFAASCAVLVPGARRGDYLVMASAVGPMFAATAASFVTPVWVPRYFRFAQLFVLTTLVLAAWRITRGARILRISLLAALVVCLLAANLVFWNALDIPNGPGCRGLVARIRAGADRDKTIVVLDYRQYFPIKYYAGSNLRVRLVRPAFNLSWGPHLIRPSDLIEPEAFAAELRCGVWVVGTLPIPSNLPELEGLKPAHGFCVTSYHRMHRRLYANYYVATAAKSTSRPLALGASP